MIDGWSWFRERADAELGDTPPAPEDRLGDVLDRAGAVRRRRYAELGAAAGVVVVSLALVGATVSLGRTDRSPAGPGLPAPSEVSGEVTDGGSPTPAPGPVRPADPTRTGVASPSGGGLLGRPTVGTGGARLPLTTRASAPMVTTTTTPRPSVATTRPTTSPTLPSTTTTPPPTTPPPTTTPPAPPAVP